MKRAISAGAVLFAGALLFAGCGADKAGAPGAAAGALSDDEAHKLYQAAANTGDRATILAACAKIGLGAPDGAPDLEKTRKFTEDHGAWAQKNTDFLQALQDKAKAADYCKARL